MPTSVCPECSEDVYVDAECEQGDVVSCEDCHASLVVVGLDPIELDLRTGEDDDIADPIDEFSAFDTERY